MSRSIMIAGALLLTHCAAPSQQHHNPLLLNVPIPREARIEYRDLTTPVGVAAYLPTETEIKPTLLQEPGQVPEISLHSCGVEFTFQPGMLRQNLIEALTLCGYSMGAWTLGNDEFLIDFPVRSSFVVAISDAGLTDVLDVVTAVYGVQGAINPLTQTVDFSRAISTGDVQ